MPITRARSTDMIRRQSFVGKSLTFIEVGFNSGIGETATTPESQDSAFQKVTNVINSQTGNGGTLLACSYDLGRKATTLDETLATAIDAGNSIDVYQYIVEGDKMFDEPASAGAAVGDDSTVIDGSETDLLADIKSILSDESTNDVFVKIKVLPADGVSDKAGVNSEIFGMFDQRGDA